MNSKEDRGRRQAKKSDGGRGRPPVSEEEALSQSVLVCLFDEEADAIEQAAADRETSAAALIREAILDWIESGRDLSGPRAGVNHGGPGSPTEEGVTRKGTKLKPADKERLKQYVEARGMSMNYFVRIAVLEALEE